MKDPLNEVNPDSPVVHAMRTEWHKIVGVLIHKYSLGEVVVTSKDVDDFSAAFAPEEPVVLADSTHADGLHVRLVSLTEAKRVAALDRAMRAPTKGGVH